MGLAIKGVQQKRRLEPLVSFFFGQRGEGKRARGGGSFVLFKRGEEVPRGIEKREEIVRGCPWEGPRFKHNRKPLLFSWLSVCGHFVC